MASASHEYCWCKGQYNLRTCQFDSSFLHWRCQRALGVPRRSPEWSGVEHGVMEQGLLAQGTPTDHCPTGSLHSAVPQARGTAAQNIHWIPRVAACSWPPRGQDRPLESSCGYLSAFCTFLWASVISGLGYPPPHSQWKWNHLSNLKILFLGKSSSYPIFQLCPLNLVDHQDRVLLFLKFKIYAYTFTCVDIYVCM